MFKFLLFQVVNWFRSISDSDFNDDETISYEQGKGVTVVDIESDDLSTLMKEVIYSILINHLFIAVVPKVLGVMVPLIH